MNDYHEPVSELRPETRDIIRALNTFREELEAIDWYQQRMDAADEKQLISILEHNRNEEMEHACMALEWLRRNQSGWDEKLRTYLFTDGNISGIEKQKTESGEPNGKFKSLNIGKSK